MFLSGVLNFRFIKMVEYFKKSGKYCVMILELLVHYEPVLPFDYVSNKDFCHPRE